MILFKMIKHDMKNGIRNQWKKYIFTAILSLLFCMDAYHRLKSGNSSTEVCLGDFWFYPVSGIDKYIYSPQNPFRFSTIWMVWMSWVIYSVLSYPYHDLMSVGKSLLVISQKRQIWWFSKVIWMVINTVIMYMELFGISYLFCMLMNVELVTGSISERGFDVFVLQDTQQLNLILNPVDNLNFEIVILPFLVCVALEITQLVIGLFVKPFYGYMVILAYLVASTYFTDISFIGNLAMVRRNSKIMLGGVDSNKGFILVLIWIVIIFCIGLFRFRKYDILEKE